MKFSITIPAYKRRFLTEAIDSCLAQTYTDFELIIVNDHSPEDLDAVVNKYDDPRIRYYVNEKNCGAVDVVDNWNICLSYAKGDYIICMGDDDRLLPCCLEEYAKLIEQYPGLNVYHARTEIIDDKSEFMDLQEVRPERESVYSIIWHRFKGRKQYIGDFLFRKDTLRKNGGFYKIPLATFSDDISVVIAANHDGIANMQSFGFQYREHPETISRLNNPRQIAYSAKAAHEWFKGFLSRETEDACDEKYRQLTLAMLPRVFNRWYYGMMEQDISANPIVACKYWLKVKDDFGFTTRHIVRLCMHYMKLKILKR